MKEIIKIVNEKTIMKLIKKIRYIALKNRDFSIISNNCWGGHIYQYFGMKYTSPTIGLTFFADEYIKFVTNFDYYINCELTFIPKSESKYYYRYKDRDKYYPIGKQDDIEVVFLHYKSEEEAYQKWNRRKKRINYNNLIFKFNDMNLAKKEDVLKFDALPYKNKICFVANEVPGTKSTVVLKMYNGLESIENDVTMYRKYLNPIKWLNSMV